ncbi:MAG: transglycosylase SLT domain-containing protein [Burkholderiales bacterium]|nr:transglycosylase SLT domain-containing protein [Burkholderiales bacterium]
MAVCVVLIAGCAVAPFEPVSPAVAPAAARPLPDLPASTPPADPAPAIRVGETPADVRETALPPVLPAPSVAPRIAVARLHEALSGIPAEPFPAAAGADLEPLPPQAPDLWSRIVSGYSIPDLVDDPRVTKWEQWYSERPDYVARMIDRSRRYLYHVVSEVESRRLPLDLALLPMVESAFNPLAMSRARASGMWQFIPSTGRQYGLAQNFWYDSRRDVLAATESALDYLEKLHGDFGDWQLALAAYNWGEGNVARAVAKNRARGKPADYAALPMPVETRNYLPKLQAVKNLIRDPERYGLVLAEVPDSPYFTAIKTSGAIDVKLAAELAEMSVDEFVSLNPQHNRPVIAGADEHTILLPIDRAEMFAAKLELADQPRVTWQAHRMRSGETPAQIAARFGLPVETLRAVNGLGPRTPVPVGHALLVPAQIPSDATAESLAKTVFTSVPSGRTLYHTVRHGETMSTIASRYGVTAEDLRRWNGLSQNALRSGQRLRVTTDVVTGGRSRPRPAAGPRAPSTAPKAPAPVRAPTNAKANGTRGG